MTPEELETEVTRLRGALDKAGEREVALVKREKELTHRNVTLYERIRYVEHQLRGMHTAIAELLANGVDHE